MGHARRFEVEGFHGYRWAKVLNLLGSQTRRAVQGWVERMRNPTKWCEHSPRREAATDLIYL